MVSRPHQHARASTSQHRSYVPEVVRHPEQSAPQHEGQESLQVLARIVSIQPTARGADDRSATTKKAESAEEVGNYTRRRYSLP